MSNIDQIIRIFEDQEKKIKDLETTLAETENKLHKALDRLEMLEQTVAYVERDIERGYTLEA